MDRRSPAHCARLFSLRLEKSNEGRGSKACLSVTEMLSFQSGDFNNVGVA